MHLTRTTLYIHVVWKRSYTWIWRNFNNVAQSNVDLFEDSCDGRSMKGHYPVPATLFVDASAAILEHCFQNSYNIPRTWGLMARLYVRGVFYMYYAWQKTVTPPWNSISTVADAALFFYLCHITTFWGGSRAVSVPRTALDSDLFRLLWASTLLMNAPFHAIRMCRKPNMFLSNCYCL